MGLFHYKIGDLAIAWFFIFIITIVLLYHALGIQNDIYPVLMSVLTSMIATVFTYYMMELKSTQNKVHDLHSKAQMSPNSETR